MKDRNKDDKQVLYNALSHGHNNTLLHLRLCACLFKSSTNQDKIVSSLMNEAERMIL